MKNTIFVKRPTFPYKKEQSVDVVDAQTQVVEGESSSEKVKKSLFFRKSAPPCTEEQPIAVDIGDIPVGDLSTEDDPAKICAKRIRLPRKGGKLISQRDGFEERCRQDVIEVEWSPVEDEDAEAQNWFSKFGASVKDLGEDVMKRIAPQSRYDVALYKLLDYLDKRMETKQDPDWDYITQDETAGMEGSLLFETSTYIVYVLEHCLADGYIEGITVECEENKKRLCQTTGIQITPYGSKYVRQNSGIGKVLSLLRSVKETVPKM